jgi:hypothetical protein
MSLAIAFWTAVTISWIAISYVVISFIEFVSHGVFMHKPTWLSANSKFFKETLDEHRTFHHGHCFPGRHFDEADDHDCVTINIHLRVFFGQLASCWMWGPLFVAAFLLGFGSTAGKILILGGFTFMLLLMLHHITWNFIHVQMHKTRESRDQWFATSKLCLYLARYHYIHHVYPRSNFCVVCPLADWLMGTFRTANEKDIADLKQRGFFLD